MKAAACVTALVVASYSFAQFPISPIRVPAGEPMKYLTVRISRDARGRTVYGPVAASTLPPLTKLYDATENWSGTYNAQGLDPLNRPKEFCDAILTPAPCIIRRIVFSYSGPVGSQVGTMSIDVNLYDLADAANPVSIFKDLGEPPLKKPAYKSVTLTNMPQGGTYTVTVNFDSGTEPYELGPFYLGLKFHDETDANSVGKSGPLLASGANTGVGLGKYTDFPFCNFPLMDSSPGDSDNYMFDVYLNSFVTVGSYSGHMSNMMAAFYGNYAWTFVLSNDPTYNPNSNYGVDSREYLPPQDKVWMQVSDGVTTDVELVTVWTDPITGTTAGGLPFAGFFTGPFDIWFMDQDGYVQKKAAAQVPDAVSFMSVYYFPLNGGDVNSDNRVNIKDLSTVLSNYNKDGDK